MGDVGFIPLDIEVDIDGTDVSSYVNSFEVEEPQKGIRTATVVFDIAINDLITFTNGSVIEIWKGEYGETLTKKLYGYIVSVTTEPNIITVVCNDEYWKATGSTIVKLYDTSSSTDTFLGDIRNIMIDILTYASLTATTATIDTTTVTVPQVLCDNVKVSEKIKELSNILAWDWYQKPSDRLIYISNSDDYPVYGTNLVVGENVTNIPSNEENVFQIINEVEIQGVEAQSSFVETFTGDDTETVFSLSRSPISTYIQVELDSVILTGAVAGSSGTYDYLINVNDGTITFAVAPPSTAADNIVVDYTAPDLTSVSVDDAESISKYTKRKIVIILGDVATVNDGIQRGDEIIQAAKDGFVSFKCNVYNATDLSCRYKVNFSDAVNDKIYDGFEVQGIKWLWPEPYDEVQLGKSKAVLEKLLFSVEERVKKLERTRREGILLTVTKNFTVALKSILDDIVIYECTSGTQTSTGKTSPAEGFSFKDTGDSNVGWNDATNITDGSVATYSVAINDGTTAEQFDAQILKATNFGFAVPTDSIINGVELEFVAKSSHANKFVDSVFTRKVNLVKDNVILSTNIVDGIDVWGTSNTTYTWGNSSEMWGTTLSPADVNSSEFGISIQPQITSMVNEVIASIATVKLNVYYTPITKTLKVKRKYSYETETELNTGTIVGNIIVSNGDIEYSP